MKYTKVFRGDMADVLFDYGVWFAKNVHTMQEHNGTIEFTYRGRQGSSNVELEVTVEFEPEHDTE